MKLNHLILTCIFLISAATIQAQDKDVESIVIKGKWYFVSATYADQKISFSKDEQASNWMIFHKDGKHEVMSRGSENIGTWKYNKETKTFTFTDKGNEFDLKVFKIDAKNLHFKGSVEGRDTEVILKKKEKK